MAYYGNKSEKPGYSPKSKGQGNSLNMESGTKGRGYQKGSLNKPKITGSGQYPHGFASKPIPSSEQ